MTTNIIYCYELLCIYNEFLKAVEKNPQYYYKKKTFIFASLDLLSESQTMKKGRRKVSHSGGFLSPERRRKPVTVTGPYIVYMLKDMDIISDWTTIKKVGETRKFFVLINILNIQLSSNLDVNIYIEGWGLRFFFNSWKILDVQK